MRDFDTSGRSSDAAQVFTPCPIHCQGYRHPIFPCGLATDTAPGLATDAQARRNISHYQFIVNTAGCLLSQLSEQIWGPPVCAGTTRRRRTQAAAAHPCGGGRTRASAGIHGHPHRHSRKGGNPRRGGAGGWVPVSTGTTMGIHIVIPATAGGRRWVPACAGTTVGTHIVIPATAGGRRWVPACAGTTGAPTIVIPAKAGIHGRWVPVSTGMGPAQRLHGDDRGGIHGDDGGHPHRHSREGGNPRRRAGGDGFPSPRERRRGGSQVISE